MRKRSSKKLLPIGQPPATLPYGQVGGSLPTVINNLVSFTNFLIVTGIVLGAAAVVGVGVSSHLWVTNVHQVDGKVDANTADINILRADIASINGSLPVGNGTVFFDDMWLMANGPQPAKQFMLNASLITPLVKTNNAFPNVSGIVALQETLPTTFAESLFAVTGDVDPKRIEFSLDLLASSAMRVFRWPNKDGVVATISDVIAVAGNTSVFLDSDFALLNDPDTTKRMQFSAAQISSNTNRTYSVPDTDGTFLVQQSNGIVQTQQATIRFEASNNFYFVDPSDTTKRLRMNVASLSTSTLRTITWPDTSMSPVGQSSGIWDTVSLSMVGGAGTYNTIVLQGTTETDRFFRFRTGGGGNNGRAGVTLSAFDSDSYSIYAAGDSTFRISHNTSVPSAYGELGTTVISIDDSTDQVRIHQQADDSIYAGIDVSALTSSQVFTLPSVTGQVLVAQSGGSGIVRGQNAAGQQRFSDALFALSNSSDNNARLVFSVGSATGATRTASFIDADITVVGEDATQILTNKDITDSSNDVRATLLATTAGGSVDISAASAPAAGDVLTATSATTAAWGVAMPTGSVLDYAGATAPSGWLLCYGQAISRTTYATLFGVVGTTYGAGDGSTTFNVPDLRGRAIAGKDNMGGTSANRLTGTSGGVNGNALGNAGGAQTHTLTTQQLAQHSHTTPTATLNNAASGSGAGNGYATNGGNSGTANLGATAIAGNNQAHNNVQPTFILNKIIRT